MLYTIQFILYTSLMSSQQYRQNVMWLIFNQQHKFLLVQYASSGTRTFPKGWLEPGETLEEGLYREVEEETGLTKDHLNILNTYPTPFIKDFTPEQIARKIQHKNEHYIGKSETACIVEYTTEKDVVNIGVSEELSAHVRVGIEEVEKYIHDSQLLQYLNLEFLERYIHKWNID